MSISKSDILKKAIYKALDEGVDLSTNENRKKFWQDFCNTHSNFDVDTGRPLFVKVCKKCYENLGVDQSKVGLSRKKTYMYNRELAEKMMQEHQEPRKETVQEPPQDKMLHIQDESIVNSIKYDHWTLQSASALIRCMLAPLYLKYPHLQLSDDEIEALARMWLPTLQRYGSELVQYVILPLLGFLGIIGTHIYKGYKLHKEKSHNQN